MLTNYQSTGIKDYKQKDGKIVQQQKFVDKTCKFETC